MQLAMQSCDCPAEAEAKLSHGFAQFVIHPAQAAAVPIPRPTAATKCVRGRGRRTVLLITLASVL